VAGASGGDPFGLFLVDGVQGWAVGLDNSDSDSFKIAGSAALGTNDYLTITTSGLVGIGTTIPNVKLHVVTTGDVDAFILGEESASTGKQLLIGYHTTSNYGSIQTIHQGTAFTTLHLNKISGDVVIHEDGNDADFRVESDDEAYCLMVEGTLNNLVFCANAEPGFNSMDGGIFIQNSNVIPAGNPTAGGYMYAEGGALKWRGPSGAITTMGAA
jgi:hypothetical protein